MSIDSIKKSIINFPKNTLKFILAPIKWLGKKIVLFKTRIFGDSKLEKTLEKTHSTFSSSQRSENTEPLSNRSSTSGSMTAPLPKSPDTEPKTTEDKSDAKEEKSQKELKNETTKTKEKSQPILNNTQMKEIDERIKKEQQKQVDSSGDIRDYDEFRDMLDEKIYHKNYEEIPGLFDRFKTYAPHKKDLLAKDTAFKLLDTKNEKAIEASATLMRIVTDPSYRSNYNEKRVKQGLERLPNL